MSKKLKLAPQGCQAPVNPTNWNICVLCQERGEKLINPSPRGYTSLATNLASLHELNSLPLNINISRLDDGEGIEEALLAHTAKWHKACYVLCNATKVERAKNRQEKASHEIPHTVLSSRHLRRASEASECSTATKVAKQPACFFCDETTGEFHKAATITLDTRVRKIATELEDTKLLAKLAAGDMIAIDAVYHFQCLTALYNNHRSQLRRSTTEQHHQINPETLALAEVVSYIEEYGQQCGDLNHMFKLSDLKDLYCEHLEKLGGDSTGEIHSTRLAQKIQKHIPALESHNSKSGLVLTFRIDVGDALLDACDRDEEAVMVMRVAKLVRKEIFEKKYHFNGSLCDDQYEDLPTTLSTLVEMILDGTNARQHDDDDDDRGIRIAASSITQLLIFNAVARIMPQKDSVAVRHSLDRETALPLYLGLLIHNKTRKRDLIDKFYEKGLSVSYDRVLRLSTQEANRVIDMYENMGCVLPSPLRNNLFSTGNFDNLDHNTRATLSVDAYHGTAISITQHITADNPGVVRIPPESLAIDDQSKSKSVKSLPKSYTDVPPVSLGNDVSPPVTDDIAIPVSAEMGDDEMQTMWFENARRVLQLADENQNDQVEMNVSWSAYFASLQEPVSKPPAITAILPLFRDVSHTPAMVKHGMDIIKQATEQVNPGQIPVFTVDQPLYAIAKRIQWKWPEEYGESQYVVLMGGLHIEMALLKVIGDWLDGSGWTFVMTSANVTTEGRAVGVQKGSHTSRGQWAHQVTAASLYILLQRSYADYQINAPDDEQIPYDEWCQKMASEHPQFDYWYKVWQLELLFLQFLRSQREQNYAAYVESLGKIIPWMFALDHYHYARWMTVHVRDLLALEINCPSTHAEFLKGNFVTQKTEHKFSSMAHDQVHEQMNAVLKGDGGIIGITENEAALTRWMVAGPETTRLQMEYEDKYSKKKKDTGRHHEQIPSVQKTFLSHVQSFTATMEEIGNPFADTGTDLYTLDTKVIVSDNVVETIRSAEDIGKTQYKQFVAERMNSDITAFNNTIHKNNLPLFSSSSGKKPSKSTSKISNLRNDVHLFSRMYIACQARESDMDAFFEHENHAWPPSLASNGIMHQTSKSDLMDSLESLAPKPESIPDVDVKIVDGAALVHMLDPKKSQQPIKTFEDYSALIFLPYIGRLLQNVVRVDVVWDVYRDDSLKAQARQNRGSGIRMRVETNTNIPSNWKNFLRCDANKESLFQLLATAVQQFQPPEQKQVISTLREHAVSSSSADMSELSCNHEEADTRLLFHAFHSFHRGLTRIMIHATDTDVVVIAIAVSSVLPNCEMWIAFGHGAKLRYIPCHTIASALGNEASWGLLLLHAISGCDNVSAFHGIGKKTAWAVWSTMPHLKPLFARLSHAPSQVSPEDLDTIERYVVLLYQRTSTLCHVNEARKQLFSQNRMIDNIPPTLHALEQHVKRAVYQAGHIWGQSIIANPQVPSPALWGWEHVKEDSPWTPCWTTLPEAAKACQELLQCGCKKACTKRCKCVKANLQCTQLCVCAGQCNR